VGISGDLIHPYREFALSSVSLSVLQDAQKDVLNQVFADTPISGQAQEEIKELNVVFLEQDG